jgi:hypothetical protein
MAAQNAEVSLTADTWTLVSATTVAVSIATFFNKGDTVVEFLATAAETTPTSSTDGAAIPYLPGQGEKNVTLSDIWSGITPARLYAKSLTNDGLVVVNHVA